MKRVFNLFMAICMLASLGLVVVPPVQGSASSQYLLSGTQTGAVSPGMPGRSIPKKAIAHLDPGQPFGGADYTIQVKAQSTDGTKKTVTLTGMDAMLADGVINDPLQGNYQIVKHDQVMVSSTAAGSMATYSVTPDSNSNHNPVSIDQRPLSNFNDTSKIDAPVRPADLNQDGIDEQILLLQYTTGGAGISVGDLPESARTATSAPAVVVTGGQGMHMLVRGYDQSLWHCPINAYVCSAWENDAGGLLVSAPAAASNGGSTFNVLAIGADYQVYLRAWTGSAWSADWVPVSDSGYLNPKGTDAPAAVMEAGSSNIEVFRRGPDNTLRYCHYTGASCGAWQNLGGVLTSAPAAVISAANNITLFARGVDNQVWSLQRVGGQWGIWHALPALPGTVLANSEPSATFDLSGKILLFLLGSDHKLWQNTYSNGAWGNWNYSPGSTLASVPAAVAIEENPVLFAQSTAGGLQLNPFNGGMPLGWFNFNGPAPCCQVTSLADTGGSRQIKTGYFTGDGRAQIVYRTHSGTQTDLKIFDIVNGFRLKEVASKTVTGVDAWGAIETGDFNHDGRDEIAFMQHVSGQPIGSYRVSLYTVQPAAGGWTISSAQSFDKSAPDPAGGTFQTNKEVFDLSAGDYYGDGDIKLAAAAYHQTSSANTSIDILDIDAAKQLVSIASTNAWHGLSFDYLSGSIRLASGHLGGLADKLVVTAYYPELNNGVIQVYSVSDKQLQLLASTPRVAGSLTADRDKIGLAVGDFDRDFQDEIVFLNSCMTQSETVVYNLRVIKLESNNSTWTLVDTGYTEYPTSSYDVYGESVMLSIGSYSGQSLRVGTPTYREQTDLGDIVTVINQPPRHSDILDGVGYSINTNSYATYEVDQSHGSTNSIAAESAYTLDQSMAIVIGNPTGTHLQQSLDASYGTNFSTAAGTFSSVAVNEKVQTGGDDWLIYTGKDLEVWEYPVYSDSDQTPDGKMIVVFPKQVGTSSSGRIATNKYSGGGNACNFWYAPSHEINNVWSYPSDVSDIVNPADPKVKMWKDDQWYDLSGANNDYAFTWSEQSNLSYTSAYSQKIDNNQESQLGGDSFDVGVTVGEGVQFNTTSTIFLPSLKTNMTSSYTRSILSTISTTTSTGTTFGYHFEDVGAANNFKVKPIIYWDRSGYLIYDYATQIDTTTSFWSKYNKTDPAFSLPWWTGAPCGTDNQTFSKDMSVTPPYAANGETVTIQAVVHNFSNIPVDNVRVRFYLGDPAMGGSPIGTDQLIPTLGKRGRVTVSTTWQARGSGTQKIYAVIDPDKQIVEMHDETSNSEMNNNTAFTTLQMGNSGYVDPGGAAVFDYQNLSFADAQHGSGQVYIPTGGVSNVATNGDVIGNNTMRYELKELAPSLLSNGKWSMHSFTLTAFLAGSDRNKPYDDPATPGTDPVTFGPAPAYIRIHYNPWMFHGVDENSLLLYRRSGTTWVDAACGSYQRHPDEHWMMVPVCQTGEYAMFATSPFNILVPMTVKK